MFVGWYFKYTLGDASSPIIVIRHHNAKVLVENQNAGGGDQGKSSSPPRISLPAPTLGIVTRTGPSQLLGRKWQPYLPRSPITVRIRTNSGTKGVDHSSQGKINVNVGRHRRLSPKSPPVRNPMRPRDRAINP